MSTRRLWANPARIASVVSRSNTYAVSRSGTYSFGLEKAGTLMATSRPNVLRTSTIMSGAAAASRPFIGMLHSIILAAQTLGWAERCVPWVGRAFLLRETCRPEMTVGLDDLPQPLFCAPVSAVGVGVQAFHKFLIPGLYLVQGGVVFEIKNRQRIELCLG